MTKQDTALLSEALEALENMDCQFFACNGPTLRPIHMMTCNRCRGVAKLANRLGVYIKRADRETYKIRGQTYLGSCIKQEA